MGARTAIAAAVFAVLLAPIAAHAWEKHEALMGWIVPELPASTREVLSRPIAAACPAEDAQVYGRLVGALLLNPDASLRPSTQGACTTTTKTSGAEILEGPAVDDPDHGMDENLDDGPGNPYDPEGYRKWMGGARGPTSKGFRHMYFGGWKPLEPLATFQIPPGAMGYSPQRVALLARTARELLRSGHRAWGYRVLAWAAHYVQDLAQPFHSAEIPDLDLVPWHVLLDAFKIGPGPAFGELVKETTRTIGNYHWALEDYTLMRLQEGHESPFAECFHDPAADEALARVRDPEALAHAVARRSIRLAQAVGSTELRFFGRGFMERSIDLPHGDGKPDYKDFERRPDLAQQRLDFQEATCRALGNAGAGTQALVDWALEP